MKGESRMDALARDLAGGQISRRGALARLTGAAATTLVPSFLLADEALAACPPSRKCGSKCCPQGAKCKRGKCKCKSGLKKCGKKCVNVATDPANCGSCGRACASGQTCANGQCTGGTTTQPVCGDGKAEGSEICDGADLKGATCQSLGFLGGTLRCGPNCTYDFSTCTSPSCTTAADCPQGPAGDCQKAVCTSGTCGFETDNADVPVDSNQCTTGTCAGGVPAQVNVAAGAACATGVCNRQGQCVGCNSAADCPQGPGGNCQKAVCNAGVCGFATDNTDVPATDGNPCTVETCVNGAPSNTSATAGTTCGTNMVCNGASQCVGCNDPSTCPQPTADCEVATCNSGVCGFGPGPDGGACDDNNLCTSGTTCQAGTCTGTAVVCSASDQCHDAGVCDPGTGNCSNPAKANGATCNGGNACTQSDTCQAGVCQGSSPVVCTASDACHTAGVCDSGTGQCSNPAAPQGTACSFNGGTVCNGAGQCVGCNQASDCPVPANTCLQRTCNSNTCGTTNASSGTACSTGCASGTCNGAGTCNLQTFASLGTACTDNNACTTGETCNGAGSCTGGTPVICQNGACNPVTGCP